MKKILKTVLSTVAGLLCAFSALAQVTTADLSGRISDAEGFVAGAPVIALYVPTGTTYYGVSDANGNYRINSITPGGPYSVTVDMLGYQKVTVTGVYAALAENNVLDFKLEQESLGLDATVITADALNSSMNIQRSGAGTSISSRKMSTVPTVSRSMNDIMKLTPQASSTTAGFAVGGGNYRGSSVTVDGAAFNNAFGIGSNLPAGGSPISLDAIDQISVNITPFDVRQSGFQGGAINAVTKSGTNDFHASVYDYYTSDKVRGDKVNGNKINNTEMLNNTVGMTVGGPIIKNKLFFFVNAEYTFDKLPGTTNEARTSADQQWGDDVIYNRPLASDLDEIKSFLSSEFGYNPGRYQGYSLKTPDYKVLARVDWNINDNNRFNVRFSHTHTYGSNPPSSSMSPIGGTNSNYVAHDGSPISFNRYSAGRQSSYALYFENSRYFQEQNFTSVAAELNSRLMDGRANNTLRFTWSHQDEPRSYDGKFFPTVDILSNSGVTGNNTSAIYTTFGLDPFTYGNLRDVQTLIGTDELSYSVGVHNITGGVQFEWNRAKNGFMQGGAGWYIYESAAAFMADVTNPGPTTGPAAFMITHANLDDPTKQAYPTFDYSQLSWYAQDEMNINDYLKFTAGVRFELPWYNIPNDNYNKDFAAVAAANPGSTFAGLSTDQLPQKRVMVSPRLGFNWDILKNRNLILRGGTGIFAGRIPNVWIVSAMGNSNVLQYQYVANPSTGNPVVHFSDDRNTIINSIYSSGSFVKQDLPAPSYTTIIAKDFQMPSSWKSSLAVDANLPWGIKGTFEGVYSYNFNEVYATSLGYVENGTVSLPGESGTRALFKDENIRNSAGSRMHGYYIHNEKDIHGHYYSLTAQLSKTFAWGLDLTAAYTYSDSRTISDGNGDQISEFANIYNKNGCNVPELGYSGYVTPHRAIASASYTINEGKHLATKLGVFYEGSNIGFFNSYSYSRMSYLMSNVSGAGSAAQLIYIPTANELSSMPFSSAENRNEFAQFIEDSRYLSNHRGEYMKRNAIAAPWLNRVNFKIAQDFYFNVGSRKHTLELSCDINNLGNLLNSDWGCYKILSSNVVLNYKDDAYTFTKPSWKKYSNLNSTWQMLFSAKWSF